jgi:DNA polymerase III epsilon subunit-like protein
MSEPPRKRRKCSNCKEEGHDRRNCPLIRVSSATNLAILGDENDNGVEGSASRAPPTAPAPPAVPNVNWDQVYYVLFDLETTGGSRTDDDIIELAAMILGPDGIALEDGSFEALIRPSKDISQFITSLTGITNDMVQTAPDFRTVITEFFHFMGDVVQQHATATTTEIGHIVLVAHNGRVFDVPFLMRSLCRHNLQELWIDVRYGLTIDTLYICKRIFANKATRQPTNMKLGTIFQFLTGKEMENSHRAMSDVNALYSIFRSELFWNNRKESLQTSIVDGGSIVDRGPGLIWLPNHDSDVSDSSDSEDGDNGTRKQHRDEDDTNISEDEDESNEQAPAGDYWRKIDFVPLENPAEKFNAAFTSSCRSGANRTGLQVSPAMANSPIKAWRLIFTASILDRLVQHTNKYGYRNAKDWSPITRRDMTDFFAVLFVMSVQKRKDKPSNWFSDNPLLESKVAKKITTGRQFGKYYLY